MPVLLHVGCEKTGTKSIQGWLRDHEDLLAEHRVRFPRGWLRLNVHQELPLTLMRVERMCIPRVYGDEWRDPLWRMDVCRQVHDDLARHASELTVLSSENLDLLRFDDEFAALRALVGDAVIVIYLRNPDDWLGALRNQYLNKSGPDRSLSDDPDAYNYLAADSWRADYDTLLAQWRAWFSDVRVEDYDAEIAREGSVLPSMLRHLGLPVIDVDDYWLNRRDDPTPRAPGNRSLGRRFGQPVSLQNEGRLSGSSMPVN